MRWRERLVRILDVEYERIENRGGFSYVSDTDKHHAWWFDAIIGGPLTVSLLSVTMLEMQALLLVGAVVGGALTLINLIFYILLIPNVHFSEEGTHRLVVLMHYTSAFLRFFSIRLWWATLFRRPADE